MGVNLIIKYIILIYFKIKNILKNKYYYIFKHTINRYILIKKELE